ncbi:MAG: GspH/FimT family pseudopilin [Phycisphaerae bacterium]|nr:GspH/FimT family pseudopilin [Phycisphaerae bacterium]
MMTSGAGQKKTLSNEPSLPATETGFTLLEMVLAVALVVMLSGVFIVVFSGSLSKAQTDAASGRIASLLRSTRAEAALAGRRFRLTFDTDTDQPIVTIERDGLGEPGAFTAYKAWWIEQSLLPEGITVAACELSGESTPDETDKFETDEQDDPDEITFMPDGSSDSARIVLTSDEKEHPWAVEITLNGIDGTITTREIDLEEEGTE